MFSKPHRGTDKIRALVVDDSVVMRRLVTRMLSSHTGIEVVGSARDGREALLKVEQLRPSLVTLDIEMPEMDGLEALKIMQARFPEMRVIMCSSLTARGAAITIDALLAGASDYVTKQSSSSLTEDAYWVLQAELLAKIECIFRLGGRTVATRISQNPPGPAVADASRQMSAPVQSSPPVRWASVAQKTAPKILAIGVSTGGPSALAEILPQIPASFPLPIAIVQHMPAFFTKLLAERLARISRVPVVEATHGLEVKPGIAVVAPGDFHMRLARRGSEVCFELDKGEQENSCRPAVDVLFRSVADVYGGAAIVAVLTGMGQDGLVGARCLKGLGAPVVVQDSATSVVWGMPGAIAEAHLADAVLPLTSIIPDILRRL